MKNVTTPHLSGHCDVRLRFAGLCMFVQDPAQPVVHVLLPEAGHIHRHVPRVHWRDAWRPGGRPLAPREELDLGRWGGTAPVIPPGIFDITECPADCPPNDWGKVDLGNVGTARRIRLHTGSGRVVNVGASWSFRDAASPGIIRPMPTVVDWWMTNAPLAEVAAELTAWDVIDSPPELPVLLWHYGPHRKLTIDVWILHVPDDEQHPDRIGSRPVHGGNALNEHFAAYLPLLRCPDVFGPPEFQSLETEVPDSAPPRWHWKAAPARGRGPILGMLVDCGLTTATAT